MSNIHEAKSQLPSMITSLRLTQDGLTSFQDPTLYWSIVGALQYVTCTLSKLTFFVNKLFQYMYQMKEYH